MGDVSWRERRALGYTSAALAESRRLGVAALGSMRSWARVAGVGLRNSAPRCRSVALIWRGTKAQTLAGTRAYELQEGACLAVILRIYRCDGRRSKFTRRPKNPTLSEMLAAAS